ncbi:MAG TPA: GAF domain-containing SpoIIE family protein phosphatase [Solirubrobacteraceae bacterium]|jgi:serine phosphatase RsbU (regulator of sigma subunit)|nr:GAF domain-containing SpoIIE family protein phosphatase [Solirubrobacteraceae bacterium]
MSDAGVASITPEGEVPEQPLSGREVRAAILSCAGLYAVGGALCATALLLPEVRAPAAIAAVGVNAYLVAAALVLAARRAHVGLELAFAADLWGIVLIAILCGGSNGAGSPFALIYFFAIGHAAAFQPRSRFIVVTLAGLIAFLLPLIYEHVSPAFGAVACVGIVLALLTTVVIHLALGGAREHRRRLKFLIDATARLDTSLDPAEALRNLARAAVPDLAELCVVDLLNRDGTIATTVAASVDPTVATGVERLRTEVPLNLDGGHPVARALREGAPCVIADLTDADELAGVAQNDEHQRFMQAAGYRSAAVFPMIARGRTHGTISFLHVRSNARYSRGVLDVLEDLSGRAAMAFDNARLYAERTRVAQTLRRSLMPSVLPRIPGLELASFFRPLGAGSEVGGDFYDAFGDERSCWLVVGDVCGKGAEAAALTGFLRHTTVAYARGAVSPGEVLTRVNRVMLEQDFEGRFATAILVNLRFDGANAGSESALVTVASAGHPAALLARGDGSVGELGERGALLGVFADATIAETSTVLAPGDSLSLYTDGLLEAHAPARTLTSQEMIQRLQRSVPAAAGEAIDALLELAELDEHVRDDVAILTARVTRRAGSVTRLNRMIDREQSAPGGESGPASELESSAGRLAPIGRDRRVS